MILAPGFSLVQRSEILTPGFRGMILALGFSLIQREKGDPGSGIQFSTEGRSLLWDSV